MSEYEMEQKREEVIAFLTDCFARDILTTDEYELRVVKTNEARFASELDDITRDLQAARRSSGSLSNFAGSSLSTADNPQRVLTLLGSQELTGDWLQKDNLTLQVFMGSLKVDLRECALFRENRIQVYSLMGEIHIKVPEGVALTSSIAPILAEIKRKDRNPESLPGAPVIHISGVAIMSDIKISG